MPKIAINELHLAGAHFFGGSENFLDNLTDDALINVVGGAVGGAYYGDTHEEIFPPQRSILCSPNFSVSFGPFPPSSGN